MATIEWLHFYIMPILGWYFLVVIIIGLVAAILIRRKEEGDFWPLLAAMLPFIIGWLPMIFWLVWSKTGSIRYERERRAMRRELFNDKGS